MNVTFPFVMTGVVTHGNHLGTGIEMPTANIVPNEDITGLKFGVYYSVLKVDGVSYKAITNLGIKPTVKSDGLINAESFIYDFEGDIYGKEITVKLLEFKRPEIKFSSFEELSVMMHKDLEDGKNYRSV